MNLPALTNWEETGQNLHRAARLLGALRLLLLEARPRHLEHRPLDRRCRPLRCFG